MRIMILLSLVAVVSCVSHPSLEELEDEASQTGDWTVVERREELDKERLELSAPGCSVGLNKYCIEDSAGCPDSPNVLCTEEVSNIICYCMSPIDRERLGLEIAPDN